VGFLSDVYWSWRVVVRRVSGGGLCLGRACLLMRCVGCVEYVTSRQSCYRCLMLFVKRGVVEGGERGYGYRSQPRLR
jgi:hypothetical protein